VKVSFAIPTLTKPYQQTLDSLAASVPLLDAAGIEHCMVSEVGSPYISCARATMLRKALDAKCDAVVFIDHDLSWRPSDLLKLIQTEGDVVAGTYRFKQDKVEFMGAPLVGPRGHPLCRDTDGAVQAHSAPAGFLKVTRAAVGRFMQAYPGLVYGDPFNPSVDLFNHGAHRGLWWGEDYAFCRNWRDCGGEVWIVPDLELTHHTKEAAYPGNYHEYLLSLPKGDRQ
jgi:glycosyltransferase involved in cell wall biosynthesis